jgi:hypothetical protein
MDGQTSYQYNAQNLLLREDFRSLGHGALPTSSRYSYDALGRQIERVLDIEGRAYSRYTSWYEGENLVKEERVHLVPECADGPQMKREFTSVTMPGGDPTRPARTEEYVHEYDLCSAKDGWLEARTTYTYAPGSSNPKTKTIESFSAGELAASPYTILLSYNAKGKLQEELYTSASYPGGYAKVKYTRPTSEQQTIEYDMNLDGVVEYSTTINFDASGKPASEERFEGKVLRWRRDIFYDSLGRESKEEIDGSGSNKADGEVDHRSLYQYECKAM